MGPSAGHSTPLGIIMPIMPILMTSASVSHRLTEATDDAW